MGKPIFGNELVAFGTPLSAWGPRTATVLGINTSFVLPVGWWLIETDAGTTVRYTYDGGTNYITRVAASSVESVWSDGYAVEIRGGGAGGTAQRSAILAIS